MLEERKFSKSRASVQCQGSWETAWGRESAWKLKFRDPGPLNFLASGISSVWKADVL